MFSTKHYVPIIKAKEGEFKALQETFEPTKDGLTPLFEVVGIAWDYEEGSESKTIDDHLSKIGKKLLDCWGVERRVFVDSNLLDPNRLMLDGATHHLVHLFNDFRARNIKAIPTTALDRSPNYKQAVSQIVGQDNRGICLRLQNASITILNLKESIDADLNLYGINPNDCDLIIDLESINGNNSELLVFTLVTFINNALPYVNDWRSVTIASTSFPTDLSDIGPNTIDSIDRTEWMFWRALIGSPLKRVPSFGDYSIAHPEMLEMDPRNMRVSASIRYTHDTYWLIVRGKWLRKFGFGQYHVLCQNLIARPEFCGAAYSWADNYINDCAAGTVGTGSPTTWRKVGNNHHFQKVVTQISNLP